MLLPVSPGHPWCPRLGSGRHIVLGAVAWYGLRALGWGAGHGQWASRGFWKQTGQMS